MNGGAVAYLTHSKYGRNKTEVTINNVMPKDYSSTTIYSVTGYGSTSGVSADSDSSRNLATLMTDGQTGSWTKNQLQSSTGNIYGIYDLSGGSEEYTAGYIAYGSKYTSFAGSLAGGNTKYKSDYAGTSNIAGTNYSERPNPSRLGEAIWETSSSVGDSNSWNIDYNKFLTTGYPFSARGGCCGDSTSAGVFAFVCDYYCTGARGFRAVLVAE